ncbi:hypothetical protein HPB52_022934 [Rhipicephalus sanguineus]|uniref:Regulatory protein zeste n=1 Tax=Rhipicephalus sanguineus TaxID=34632 RepID=A0A9D4T0H2_RHISA|nr:hypothetical protein HPB52_022934 [Rhipicephalus sanguineus]
MSKKRDSWKKIQDEFNCRHNVTPRRWTQLKKCWENMKDKWRRTSAEDMRERFANGGGTPPPSQLTDELQRVDDIASHMAVRMPNPSTATAADMMLCKEIGVFESAVHTGCRCSAVGDPRQACGRVRCDNYDEPTNPWSWDDIGSPLADTSTGTALAHGRTGHFKEPTRGCSRTTNNTCQRRCSADF